MWRLKVERNGRDWYVGSNGGGVPILGDENILDIKKVKHEQDLNWSVTAYGHYEKDFGNGWLSPTGNWTQCDYTGHIDVAYYILKSSEFKLEKHNYIKISDYCVYMTDSEKYTSHQINWLKKHGRREHAEMLEEDYIIV